ncbi:hypothetical protein LT493_30325 [Streptomyces tricolor]|nr:hypothetical protein [Streptomyces tricolor]
MLIIGADGRLLLVNDEARRLAEPPADAEDARCGSCRISTRRRRSCSSPGARPTTRCTTPRDGCWRSTSGPRTAPAAPAEPS